MSTRAHVIVIVIAVGSLAFILRLVAMRQLRTKYALLWLTVGLLLLPFAAFPGLLDDIASWMGVGYAPAAFLFLALGFLAAVVVHLTWELTRLEVRSRTLAEDVALLRAAIEEPPSGPPSPPAPAGERD